MPPGHSSSNRRDNGVGHEDSIFYKTVFGDFLGGEGEESGGGRGIGRVVEVVVDGFVAVLGLELFAFQFHKIIQFPPPSPSRPKPHHIIRHPLLVPNPVHHSFLFLLSKSLLCILRFNSIIIKNHLLNPHHFVVLKPLSHMGELTKTRGCTNGEGVGGGGFGIDIRVEELLDGDGGGGGRRREGRIEGKGGGRVVGHEVDGEPMFREEVMGVGEGGFDAFFRGNNHDKEARGIVREESAVMVVRNGAAEEGGSPLRPSELFIGSNGLRNINDFKGISMLSGDGVLLGRFVREGTNSISWFFVGFGGARISAFVCEVQFRVKVVSVCFGDWEVFGITGNQTTHRKIERGLRDPIDNHFGGVLVEEGAGVIEG